MKLLVKTSFILFFYCLINAQSIQDKNSFLSNSISVLNQSTVTIGGDFIINGTFPIAPNERLDQYISRLYNEYRIGLLNTAKDDKSFAGIYDKINKYPLRNLIIKRGDETIVADLQRFRLTGNYNYNPILYHKDVVIFPKVNMEVDFFETLGSVNNPTKIQFVEGDKLRDAILFSQGINSTISDVDSVLIVRRNRNTNNDISIKIDVDQEFELQAGDRIRFFNSYVNQDFDYVYVVGAVNYPGKVYIDKKGSKIHDIIKKAGGFKSNASLREIKLVRKDHNIQNLFFNEKKENSLFRNNEKTENEIFAERTYENLLIYRLTNLSDEDTTYFNNEMKLKIIRNSVNIDLTDKNFNEKYNVDLVKEDLIVVPEVKDYVYVFGQVKNGASFVNYSKSMNLSDFIASAGGMSEYAEDEEDIILIKGNTNEWIVTSEREYEIEPGDLIYVPKDAIRSFGYELWRIGSFTSIIGSVATIILLLVQFGK